MDVVLYLRYSSDRQNEQSIEGQRRVCKQFCEQQGYTIAPLKVYFSGRKVKLEIGLAKGKKLYDKRETIAKKDMKREAERALKERNS